MKKKISLKLFLLFVIILTLLILSSCQNTPTRLKALHDFQVTQNLAAAFTSQAIRLTSASSASSLVQTGAPPAETPAP